MKKIFVIFIAFVMIFSSLPNHSFASTEVKPDILPEDIETFLEENFSKKEIKKIKEEYEKEFGVPFDEAKHSDEFQAQYGWIALVLIAALGGILATAFFSSLSYSYSWLRAQTAADGRDCGSTNVKISHQIFSANTNIGRNYSQDYYQVKAIQSYINRGNIGHVLTEDGSFGPATEAAVKDLQKRLGTTADGVVGSKTLYLMAGKCS